MEIGPKCSIWLPPAALKTPKNLLGGKSAPTLQVSTKASTAIATSSTLKPHRAQKEAQGPSTCSACITDLSTLHGLSNLVLYVLSYWAEVQDRFP